MKYDKKDDPHDLSEMTNDDLCDLMRVCGESSDKSDMDFVKACRDELSKRKPISACQPKKAIQ